MKINKRKCRAFANPDFKFPQNNGMLHANQIDFIIRTAIKIISHHKTLILYVYSRTQAVQGDFHPCLTVFQNKDDFITLECREDGSSRWRTAAFENLGDGWIFTRKCAFYSAKDESRVISYLKSSSDNGIDALTRFQYGIQERRRRKRQQIRENKIISRMSDVPALPLGLKGWIHKSVMPAYFFYDYKRGGMDVPGVCSACGKEIQLSNVKQGRKAICPHCRRELIMKPRSRRGCCMADRDTCQVIQNVGSGELVIRIVKVYYTYTGDTPKINIYENARQFIFLDANAKVCHEDYYYSYSDCLDESQDRTHRILRVSAEDVQFLRGLDVNISTLKIFQQYTGLKDRQKLLLWQLEHEVNRDILPIIEHMTVHKFIRYIERQYGFLCFRRTSYGTMRYKNMQALVSEYRDYLDICCKLKYDMKNSFVLYPKDVQKSHDKAAKRMKQKHNAKIKRDFIAVYQQLSKRLDFEKDGLKILYPHSIEDIIAEGNSLHHCVGGYVERIAERECFILFLRQCSNENKPFYTIEVQNNKAVQVRGMRNCDMTADVEKFIKTWERQVLSNIRLAA